MTDSLSISTLGWISTSSNRSLTYSTLGWLVVPPVSNKTKRKKPASGLSRADDFEDQMLSRLLREDEEVIQFLSIAIKSYI